MSAGDGSEGWRGGGWWCYGCGGGGGGSESGEWLAAMVFRAAGAVLAAGRVVLERDGHGLRRFVESERTVGPCHFAAAAAAAAPPPCTS
jgi:hypothetical protein